MFTIASRRPDALIPRYVATVLCEIATPKLANSKLGGQDRRRQNQATAIRQDIGLHRCESTRCAAIGPATTTRNSASRSHKYNPRFRAFATNPACKPLQIGHLRQWQEAESAGFSACQATILLISAPWPETLSWVWHEG